MDVVCCGFVEGWSGRTKSAAPMDHVLRELERSERALATIAVAPQILLTDGLFSAATLSSTKKTTSLNKFSATSGGAMLGECISAGVRVRSGMIRLAMSIVAKISIQYAQYQVDENLKPVNLHVLNF